jgi:hypothetical protein
MAADALASFALQFDWALDDLRALVSGRPVIAEGWGLRPELAAPIMDAPGRMVVMVATEGFRQRQLRELPRAAASARRLGIGVVEVDGSRDADGVADLVADRFRPYLPAADTG